MIHVILGTVMGCSMWTPFPGSFGPQGMMDAQLPATWAEGWMFRIRSLRRGSRYLKSTVRNLLLRASGVGDPFALKYLPTSS